MKKLLLLNDDNEYFKEIDQDEYAICYLYSSNSLLNRLYRKIIFILRIYFLIKLYFRRIVSKIEEIDTIIVFDTGNAPNICNFIRRYYPKKRIILWYWNSVAESISPDRFIGCNVEFWSFDIEDCKKYNFRFNTQFYIKENMKLIDCENSESNSVFYVGYDKNRAPILASIREKLHGSNIECDFNLVQYHNSSNNYNISYKKALTYNEVLLRDAGSKAIVDLVAEWQTGLTLRPLEALYFHKKLITNMKEIIKYDIYNPNNIFVLGLDDMDDLAGFINSDYDDSNDDFLINKYEFEEWVKRFDSTVFDDEL